MKKIIFLFLLILFSCKSLPDSKNMINNDDEADEEKYRSKEIIKDDKGKAK
ncbi:hypothetical protein F0310_04930 (plasmid) [Borrelia sp. A-FGy1]|uniref:hypothetical protein n=1 Tax=Borrelia sp. A-FGy1 TaxID=2608247 RepID=UPI0015F6EE02|nr:hypothetical protein [Borrelia sp. A-FGy1]QMU99761.1 hypothetical protein F0310_04930 [Borrelia sp. A-FGy1]